MRIAYICQYQGPDLIASRGIVRNRTLGGNRKIELIADALTRAGNDVVVFSGGVPADRTGKRFARFESTIGCRPDGARVLYAAGLDVPIANLVLATGMSATAAMREAVRGFDAILLYNITEYTVAVAAALERRLGLVPLVLEYEDAVDMSSRGVSRLRAGMWKRLEGWVRPRVRGVLAVNDVLARRIGCPNTIVVRGLVDDGLCERAATRVPPLSGDRVPVALFSGSFAPEKGLHRLLELIPRFAGRLRFAISGAGPLEPAVRAAAERWPDDLQFLGLLSRESLEEHLLDADILVNPHDDDSGAIFPFKVIEYLAAGGVVVTTRCGIESDPAFEYCELADSDAFAEALERVLTDRAAAVERAGRGHEWAAARYAADAVEKAIVGVVHTAVNGGDRSFPS